MSDKQAALECSGERRATMLTPSSAVGVAIVSQVIDEIKKENFDLKLKIHFYEQRLERLAPDQIDLALRENIQLKVEFQTLRTELKRYKKLLIEGNRAIETLTKERDAREAMAGRSAGKQEREMELELRRRRERETKEREEREALERRVGELGRELKAAREGSKGRRSGTSDYQDEDARVSYDARLVV